MANYGFNKKEIIERKIALKKLLKNSSFCCDEEKEILITIDMCDTIINLLEADKNDQEIDLTEESNSELINYIKDYVYSDSFDETHKYVRNTLCKNLDLYTSKSKSFFEFENEINFSDKEAIELVGNMIKSKLGRNHYTTYTKLFVNNPSHIHFTKDSSSLIFLPFKKEDVYAIIEDNPDISKPINIAHEAGHFFSYSSIGKGTISKCLGEVESTFYELLFCKYLIEENIYPEDAKKAILEVLLGITEKASIVNAEFSYPMYKINSVRDFKDMANRYNLYDKTGKYTTRDLLIWMMTNNEESQFNYIYSTLIALEFYDDYLTSRNKKNVVSKYERFLQEIDKVDDFKLASYITKDYITFDDFAKLRKYKQKYLKK